MNKVILTEEMAEKLQLLNNRSILAKIHRFSKHYKNRHNTFTDKKLNNEIYQHKLTRNINLYYTTEKDNNNNDYIILLDLVQRQELLDSLKPVAARTARLGKIK